MEPASELLRQRLLEQVRGTVNADGGWPYLQGKASRVEPTALAAIAMAGEPQDRGRARGAVRLLASWQRDSGLVAEAGLPENPAFSAVALLAWLSRLADGEPVRSNAERLAGGLARVPALTLANSPNNRQDNSIPGWAWHPGNFSWVEPTAWALLALKLARRRQLPVDETRVAAGERLLADRVCKGGGWNYGNSNMLGRELHPYVPTTALALLSLADRRNRDDVVRSLKYLETAWPTEPSGLPLALVLLVFRRYGVPTGGVEAALSRAHERSAFLDNLATVALAAEALRADPHGLSPFTA